MYGLQIIPGGWLTLDSDRTGSLQDPCGRPARHPSRPCSWAAAGRDLFPITCGFYVNNKSNVPPDLLTATTQNCTCRGPPWRTHISRVRRSRGLLPGSGSLKYLWKLTYEPPADCPSFRITIIVAPTACASQIGRGACWMSPWSSQVPTLPHIYGPSRR